MTGFVIRRGRMVDSKAVERAVIKAAIPLAILATPTAAGANPVQQPLQPIIKLLQDLAEPIAYACMMYGGIRYITGQSAEGKKVMRDAIGGYILIQWLPWLFSIVKTVRP